MQLNGKEYLSQEEFIAKLRRELRWVSVSQIRSPKEIHFPEKMGELLEELSDDSNRSTSVR